VTGINVGWMNVRENGLLSKKPYASQFNYTILIINRTGSCPERTRFTKPLSKIVLTSQICVCVHKKCLLTFIIDKAYLSGVSEEVAKPFLSAEGIPEAFVNTCGMPFEVPEVLL
jgi:hypothetical protein